MNSQFLIYQNQEGELYRNSVVAHFATTATDGKNYQVEYYNLDVIISVGYRVKSQQAHTEILSRV
nr:RhuM family protein [Capnocytophaga sp. oral taxon 878]